ncbi:hypothetical protein Angca_010180, partial [Angiostrongylus cantonensis]
CRGRSSEYHRVQGDGRVGDSTVRTWFQKFRSYDFDLRLKERRGCSSEFEDDKLKALVEVNKSTSVRGLAEQLGVSREAISTHLIGIGKKK